MYTKLNFLALAVAAAMFALPTVASAGTWHAEPSTAVTPITTTTAGHGVTQMVTPNRNMECFANLSATGVGQIDTGGTTGKITLTFFGCKSGGTNCTTPGQAAGTIKTSENLIAHNIQVEKEVPATKITGLGETTQITHFTCAFGLITVNITGTVIGKVEQKCGSRQSTTSLEFSAPGGVQAWMQEPTTGTKTDLTFTLNGTVEQWDLAGQ